MNQMNPSVMSENMQQSAYVSDQQVKKTNVHLDARQRTTWQGRPAKGCLLELFQGSFKVLLVKPDNWLQPSHNLEVKEFFLTEPNQQLEIPAGYVFSLEAIENQSSVNVHSEVPMHEAFKEFSFDKNLWYFDSFF